MASIEWHTVGEYRFGWDMRLNSSRFTVMRKARWWRKYEVIVQGRIEYGIVGDEELRSRAHAAIEISPGLHAADMRCVRFVTDDGSEMDSALQKSMSVRWQEMQDQLRCWR